MVNYFTLEICNILTCPTAQYASVVARWSVKKPNVLGWTDSTPAMYCTFMTGWASLLELTLVISLMSKLTEVKSKLTKVKLSPLNILLSINF